jgi:hypothetical protein
MTTYQYINPEHTLVAVIDDDGISRTSGLAESLVPEGVTPEPYIEPVARVTSVSMRQARLILLSQNMLSSIDGIIAQLPTPQKEAAQIEWEYATDVSRDSPLVAMLVQSLGLTEEDLDSLFTVASTL